MGTVVQPGLVSFLESSRVSDTATTGLHPVADNHQMLTGMMTHVVQSFHEFRDVVGRRLLLAWGRPKTAGRQEPDKGGVICRKDEFLSLINCVDLIVEKLQIIGNIQ
jgi:hypothetical protein